MPSSKLDIFSPTFITSNIEALNPDVINDMEVEAVAFDVDGTLSSYHAGEIEPSVERTLRDMGDSGVKLIIISNAYGSRVDQLNDMYGQLVDGQVISPASLVKGNENPRKYRKPSPDMLDEASSRLGVDGKDVLMVGDQVLKDIVAANRAGTKSLLVPRRGDADYWAVKAFQRPVEAVIRRSMGLPDDFPTEVIKVSELDNR
jgi:HAD superfamily phosphatase (TIGR01668 family)